MGPKRSVEAPTCQICKNQVSKYKCPACPIRYCSVACYKEHKLIHETPATDVPRQPSEPIQDSSAPPLEPTNTTATSTEDVSNGASDEKGTIRKEDEKQLRPLTSLSWPPEPDPSIFTDPLQKEDPKPLRREELLRIATSPDLRTLLSQPKLTKILSIIDSLPTKNRHTVLSKLLGLDSESLSKSDGITKSFLSGRDSPPPLGDLLSSLAGTGDSDYAGEDSSLGVDKGGWWLFSQSQGKEDKIWIGEEERNLFKLFSNSVCQAIDDTSENNKEVAWGKGGLGWEV